MQKTKYNNRKTRVKGIKFDSKLESHVYLKILELSKQHPFAYELQPEYILLDKFNVDGMPYRKTIYKGDFNISYNGKLYTIDVKSDATETPLFKLKRKLFAKRYGREVIVIKSVVEFEKWFKKTIGKEGLLSIM